MNPQKAKLILQNFDGTMKSLKLTPQCRDSSLQFQIEYYNGKDASVEATMLFEGVIAVDFEVNYFNNYIGCELFGFYEIFDRDAKINMMEKLFVHRREGYLNQGHYDYDPNEEHDMLNFRAPFDQMVQEIDAYHLYQQNTEGGIFSILAAKYTLVSE